MKSLTAIYFHFRERDAYEKVSNLLYKLGTQGFVSACWAARAAFGRRVPLARLALRNPTVRFHASSAALGSKESARSDSKNQREDRDARDILTFCPRPWFP